MSILKAPNGKPSNLTPKQWRLVRTPEFKAWFGDWENDPENASKVVDENGEPLVVYRGFNSKSDAGNVFRFGINRFKENRNANRFGHYFTRSINVAKEYAEQGEKKDEKDVIVKSYFLKADNLADLTKRNPRYPTFNEWALSRESFTEYSPYALIERLKERTIPTHSYLFTSVLPKAKNEDDIDELSELKIKELEKKIEEDKKELKGIYDSSEVINLFHLIKMISGKELDEVIKEDYDLRDAQGKQDVYKWFINYKKSDILVIEGLDLLLKDLFIENNFNGGVFNEWQFGVKKPIDKEVFFVFEPNQIKLADGSNTTFDPSNPDIRFDKGGETPNIHYSPILKNTEIVKDLKLTKNLLSLSHQGLSGGIKAVWDYPYENVSNVVIAYNNSKPIGVITDTNGVQNIFVKSEYRGFGIGKSLKNILNNIRFKKGGEVERITFYTRTYADGTTQRFSVEDYENNVLPTLPKDGKFDLGGEIEILLAPNGKPSNLTPEQYKLVRTPAFKKWFGDWENDPKNASKVVDSNGEPLVVWHGGEVRNIFDKSKIGKNDKGWFGYGFYFTEDKSFANSWGESKPYFIIIKNPFEIIKKGISLVNPFYNNSIVETDNKIKEGYDGSIFKLSKPNEYVVFYEFANNIKLADGTNTTFDPSNPDIRFELGGIYHGTNQKFDKFSTDYMGGGEGAQAFGWGLYFTSLEDIAKSYANTLGKLRVKGSTKGYDQETIEKATDYANLYVRLYDSLENGIREKEKEIASKHKGHHKYDSEQMILDVIKNLEWESNKYLYQVTLHKGKNPEEYIWLDWDKPLTKNIIEKIEYQADIENIYLPTTLLYNNLTDGNKLYITLTSRFDTEKETSLFLLRAGIDGIRYPAESISRGTTSRDTRGYNYVVFDDNDITIEDVKQLAKGGETPKNYYSPILKNTEIKDMYKKGGETKSDVRSEKPALLSNGLGVLAYEVDTKKVLLFKRQNSDTYDERDRGKWGVASRGIMSKNQLSTQVAQSLLLEKAGIFSDYIVPAYVYEYDRGFQITKFHNWVAFLPDEKKIDLSNSRYADAIWISLDELSYIIGSKGEGDKDTYTIDYKDIQWGVIELFENSDIVGLIEEYAKKYKESRVTIEEEVDPKLEKERIKLKYKELDFDLDPDETKKVLLAPNGKVSNLDEKQWKAVRSANFKKWFGDWEEAYRTGDYANVSKVIDENGEPLVVYRGHSVVEQDLFGYVFSYNVNRFKFNRQPNRFAFYFTKSKKIAELYSQLSPSGERYGGVGIVKPYFLNVRGLCDLTPNNPYYPTTEWWFENIMVGKNLMVDLRFILQTKGEYDDYFYLTAYEIDTVINKYGDDSVDISRVPNILKERYRKDKNKNKVTWSGLKEYLKEILPKAKKRIDTIIKGYENSRYGHYINLNILLKCIFKTDNLSKLVDKGMLLDADMEKYLSRYTFAYFINQKSSPDGTDIVLKKMMIKKGYTGGVFLEHTYAEYLEKPNEDVYFVFDSNNIKLADGSNYTYKPDVMDTRYEDGGMFQIYPD